MDRVVERECIRCGNPIRPTAKAAHNVETEEDGQNVVAHVHGYCSYDCIFLHSLHQAFVGAAWFQK